MLQLRNVVAPMRACGAILVMLFVLNGCQSMGGSSSDDGGIWSYVPADSIYFVGGKEAMPMQDYLKMSVDSVGVYEQAMLDIMNEKNKKEPPESFKIVQQLVFSYYDLMKHPQDFTKVTGIDQNMQFAFYSVGTIPVLRIHLKDKAGFETYLQQLEAKAKITPKTISRDNLTLHQYAINTAESKNPSDFSSVIGVQGEYAVFTGIFGPSNEKFAKLNPQILGEVKPKAALNPARLDAMINKYHFDPRFLFYIDHKEIVRGITQRDNMFGAMLDMAKNMAEESKDTSSQVESQKDEAKPADRPNDNQTADAESMDKTVSEVQSPACQKELMAKVETWPQTVGGYTLLDFKKSPGKFRFKGVVEINNPKFLQSLSTLRGFIPDFVSNPDYPMLAGLGLGINVDAVAPFVAQFIKDFTAQDYQCKMLADMKAKMQQSNPAMTIAMMSGMAAGVNGISASILNFDADFGKEKGAMPNIKDAQAIVTLSANNPQMLLLLLSKIKPDLPPLQIPTDGSPVDLPLPLPIPDQVKLAQKGKHLVAYLGKDAAKLAEGLTSLPLHNDNGIYSVKFDFIRMYKLMASLPEASTASSDESIQEALDLFKKLKYRVVETINITNNGIELSVASNSNP